jgi:hypothetical protein
MKAEIKDEKSKCKMTKQRSKKLHFEPICPERGNLDSESS